VAKEVRTTPLQRAIILRNFAFEVLRRDGYWGQIYACKFLMFRGQDLVIRHWTPFQSLARHNETRKCLRPFLGSEPTKPYGLKIWHKHSMVLNIEGNPTEAPSLISFRRGDWEHALEEIAARSFSPRVGEHEVFPAY